MPKCIQDDTGIAAVSIGKYLAVMLDTGTDTIKLPTGAGVAIAGVTQNSVVGTASVPKGVTIRRIGSTKAVAAAVIAKDSAVAVDGASGKFKVAAAGNVVVGRALTAAGADGDIFHLDLTGHANYVSA